MLRRTLKRMAPRWVLDRYRHSRDLRELRRFRMEQARFRSKVVSHQYGRIPLKVWITDAVAEEWYDRDFPALTEIDFLKRSRLQAGARVFDLGAHQCVVALLLAQEVGPSGRVVAVEAHPHNAAVAARNRELNGAMNLEIVNAAVGGRAGRILLPESGLNTKVGLVNRAGGIEVDLVTVDDLAAAHGPPDVLFIDVEGYECQALRGARETLAHHPDLLIEVHVGCGLQDFGETVGTLLAEVPGGYDLFIAGGFRDGRAADAGAFEPFVPGDPRTEARFFLAAIQSSETTRGTRA